MVRRSHPLVAGVLLFVIAAEASLLAVNSKGAAYFGGTAAVFTGAKDPIDGSLNTGDQTSLIFTASDKPHRGKDLSIPYDKVIDIEYGQKAGRRVGAAVGYTILLGPLGLLTMFSKKRKHYVTIGYKGTDDKDQVAVLELGKDIVRATLPILEARSGKKIVYQDEEAKKSGK
jgi:hypothetical protein